MPDDTDEAMRDLVRGREGAVGVSTQAKQRLKGGCRTAWRCYVLARAKRAATIAFTVDALLR